MSLAQDFGGCLTCSIVLWTQAWQASWQVPQPPAGDPAGFLQKEVKPNKKRSGGYEIGPSKHNDLPYHPKWLMTGDSS